MIAAMSFAAGMAYLYGVLVMLLVYNDADWAPLLLAFVPALIAVASVDRPRHPDWEPE